MRRLLSVGLALVAVTIVCGSLLAVDSKRLRRVAHLVPEIEEVIAFAGFGLDQVSLKGQRLAFDTDIFEALKLDRARSIASFDADAARQRVEALSWIETVQFRRVWPNQLDVIVRERQSFAVWDDGKGLRLIDATGRVLSAVDEKSAPKNLPWFSGVGAPQHAHGLWQVVSQHRGIAKRFQRATRFGDRRWSIGLVNGLTIHLPAGGASGGLAQLAQWPAFKSLLERGNSIIDLRSQGRIAVRSTDDVGRTSSRPKTIADLIDPAG